MQGNWPVTIADSQISAELNAYRFAQAKLRQISRSRFENRMRDSHVNCRPGIMSTLLCDVFKKYFA